MLWSEKYRPKTEADFEGHLHLKKLLESSLLNKHPNLLLYGPPGTGKTTFAHLISKNKLELNASDERGIGVIRDTIKSYSRTLEDNKTVILDECENLTDDAQHCLRRIIEDSKNTRLIFITNYLSKVIAPLMSRLVKIRFSMIQNGLLERIGKLEGINLDHKEYKKLFRYCKGDLRRAINVLQGILPIQSSVSLEDIVGLVPLEGFKSITVDNYSGFVDSFINSGYSVLQLIHQLGETTLGGSDKQKAEFALGLSRMEEKSTLGCSDRLVLTKLSLMKLKIYNQ